MIRYITKHMRANILQVLLLCLVLMASVGVIVFASTFYFALSEHTVAGSVESQLEEFIMFISFAFAAFSFWVLYAITSITIGHREPEILVLHNTNTPDKRIIQFLFFELCITALMALIPGILLGQGVAYMVLTHANVPITEYGKSLVYLLLGSFIIALFLMSYIICSRAVVVKKKT